MLTHLGKALGNLQMDVAAHQQILTFAKLEEEEMIQRLPHTFFFLCSCKIAV